MSAPCSIQLARALTGLTVVATASRPESAAWVTGLGAHHAVDHRDLVAGVRAVAPDGVDHVFTAFSSSANVEAFAELLRVRGAVVAIDDPQGLDLLPLKARSQSWHWESMFARPLQEPESTVQRELLDEVARLVDEGVVRTTMTTRLEGLTPATLREAHQQLASSTTVGKVVLTRA